MSFTLSLAATVFCFFAGSAVAAIFILLFCAVAKKKTAASKVTILLLSCAGLISSVAFYLVFLKDVKPIFSFLTFKDYVYLAMVSVFGIIFCILTKFSLFVIFPLYLTASVFIYCSLEFLYPRKLNFQFDEASPHVTEIEVKCISMDSHLLFACPRVWYSLEGDENSTEKKLNPAFDFIKSMVLTNEQNLKVNVPQTSFYPVIYRINVKATLSDISVKLDPVF